VNTHYVEVPDDQQESEEDLSGGKIGFESVVLNADWTIETINLQVAKKNIDLSPRFQRRAAWDQIRKSRLIESIIVGMPVPNIVLAEDKHQRGKFIVIDGKQRLISLNTFINNEYALSGLDLRTDLNGKRFDDLDRADRDSFENSTLRSTVIKNWRDEEFLYVIFYRLNSGSLPLSPQELRKALIGGKLIDHIDSYITESVSFQKIFGQGLDKRMRDSELVLRFLAFHNFLPTYQGDFKRFLDNTTRLFEDNWDAAQDDLRESLQTLDMALDASARIFGDDAFKKWLGDKYERVMNRAIFDCIIRFFSSNMVRDLSLLKKDEVLDAFKDLCLDRDFRESIEKTTKTQKATFHRISAWGEKLGGVVGRNYISQAARIV